MQLDLLVQLVQRVRSEIKDSRDLRVPLDHLALRVRTETLDHQGHKVPMVQLDQPARREIQVTLDLRDHKAQPDSAVAREQLAPLEQLAAPVSQVNRANKVLPDLPEFPERSVHQVT